MSIGGLKIQQPPVPYSQPSFSSASGFFIPTSTIQTMASQAHSGGTATSVAQQNAQGGVTQQQLQLQQNTTTTTIQGHQTGNQMQPLQVIQQPLQNQLMQHQFYNTAQGQLLMPSNLTFHPGLNPQIQQQITPSIQVIAAGKTLQPNQLSAHNMFTAATSYTIPTSASNNQAYIIGQLNSHPSILQQQQTSKPGEMQKVIQPQLGTTAQIPQSIWAIPQFLNQNSILIRGTQPDQTQMFIQPQQQLHNSTSTHQHFTTMPLTGQLPSTSISSATTNGVQQVTQQQTQIQQQNHGQQSQQNQSQNQTQIATSNIVSIKAQATLQPKPPLQIQPQPATSQANQNQHNQSQQNQQQQAQQQHQAQQQQMQQQQQQQQAQQLSQLQQVTMSHPQVQMIPQGAATSQQNMLSHQILQTQQTLTAQVMQQAQQSLQQSPRQLTILPQGATQQIQPQPMTLIQQQQPVSQHQPGTQQPQPIRPNYSTANITSQSQSQGVTTTAAPQRAKVRKPGVGRGNTSASPTQQAKAMFPRPTIPTSISPLTTPQLKPSAQSPQQPAGATLTKVPVQSQASSQPQQSNANNQPLKTINLAALHTPTPNLPDATLTPLMPQSTSQAPSSIQPSQQPVQVFPTTTTQLPSPNISITPAPPPQKKEEPSNENVTPQAPPQTPQQSQQNNSQSQQHSESKSGENEKENAKTETTTEDSEEGGKNKLPKAMVKPQVLTHVIEGFVIQEASEPFPLGRNGDSDEPPLKKVALSGEMGKCEMCGKVDLRSKFKKNKRFCSSQCAKSMKVQQQQQQQQAAQPPANVPNSALNNVNDNRLKSKGKKSIEGGDSEFTDETNSSVGEASIMSPANDNVDEEPKVNPVKWNVSEVVDFVRSLPGCSEYADDFAVQEIDGQALMLLKEDHLMTAMGMKLGPALKLCAKIESIKAGMNSANGEGNQSKA